MEILDFSKCYYADDFIQAAEQAQGAKQFKEVPKSYGIVLDILKEAFENFEQGNLAKFDPLVGDCCCQIRSLMMAEMCGNLDTMIEIADAKTRVNDARDKLEKLAIPNRGKVSLVSFLSEANQRVQISERTQIIALSYLLTTVKKTDAKVEIPDVINLAPLMERGLTKSKAERIVKKAQCVLSELSVKYIQQKALELTDTNLQAMVANPYVKADRSGVQCQPFFYLTEVVLRSACRHSIPIVLEVKRGESKVEISYISNGAEYNVSNQPLSKEACMKVFGVADERVEETLETFSSRLAALGILDIIRAGAADHPQYPKLITDQLPVDATMQEYIALARQLGCSRDDARTCLISHIYAIIPTNYELAKYGS